MKKILTILLCILIISGCKKKDVKKEEKNISSKEDLVCVYKVRYTNENSMYTSYYEYNFNSNGILSSAKNEENIEFEKDDEEIKEKYEKEIKEIIEEYKDIDGIEVSTSYEDNKYSFTINMDKDKIDKSLLNKYLLNEDRVNLYNIYNDAGYTCE